MAGDSNNGTHSSFAGWSAGNNVAAISSTSASPTAGHGFARSSLRSGDTT